MFGSFLLGGSKSSGVNATPSKGSSSGDGVLTADPTTMKALLEELHLKANENETIKQEQFLERRESAEKERMLSQRLSELKEQLNQAELNRTEAIQEKIEAQDEIVRVELEMKQQIRGVLKDLEAEKLHQQQLQQEHDRTQHEHERVNQQIRSNLIRQGEFNDLLVSNADGSMDTNIDHDIYQPNDDPSSSSSLSTTESTHATTGPAISTALLHRHPAYQQSLCLPSAWPLVFLLNSLHPPSSGASCSLLPISTSYSHPLFSTLHLFTQEFHIHFSKIKAQLGSILRYWRELKQIELNDLSENTRVLSSSTITSLQQQYRQQLNELNTFLRLLDDRWNTFLNNLDLVNQGLKQIVEWKLSSSDAPMPSFPALPLNTLIDSFLGVLQNSARIIQFEVGNLEFKLNQSNLSNENKLSESHRKYLVNLCLHYTHMRQSLKDAIKIILYLPQRTGQKDHHASTSNPSSGSSTPNSVNTSFDQRSSAQPTQEIDQPASSHTWPTNPLPFLSTLLLQLNELIKAFTVLNGYEQLQAQQQQYAQATTGTNPDPATSLTTKPSSISISNQLLLNLTTITKLVGHLPTGLVKYSKMIQAKVKKINEGNLNSVRWKPSPTNSSESSLLGSFHHTETKTNEANEAAVARIDLSGMVDLRSHGVNYINQLHRLRPSSSPQPIPYALALNQSLALKSKTIECQERKHTIEELASKLDHQYNTERHLRQELTKLNELLTHARATFDQKQTDLDEEINNHLQTRLQLQATNEVVNNTKHEVEQSKKRIHELEHQLLSIKETNTSTVTRLSSSIGAFQEQLTLSQQNEANLKSELSASRAELSSIRLELGASRTETLSARTELSLLRAELTQARTELATLKSELSSTRTDLAGARTDLIVSRSELLDERKNNIKAQTIPVQGIVLVSIEPSIAATVDEVVQVNIAPASPATTIGLSVITAPVPTAATVISAPSSTIPSPIPSPSQLLAHMHTCADSLLAAAGVPTTTREHPSLAATPIPSPVSFSTSHSRTTTCEIGIQVDSPEVIQTNILPTDSLQVQSTSEPSTVLASHTTSERAPPPLYVLHSSKAELDEIDPNDLCDDDVDECEEDHPLTSSSPPSPIILPANTNGLVLTTTQPTKKRRSSTAHNAVATHPLPRILLDRLSQQSSALTHLQTSLSTADAKASQYFLQIQQLAALLQSTRSSYETADVQAQEAKKQVKKLKDELASTKMNYETMNIELTEKVCQLTEQVAMQDAGGRRR